MRAKRLFSLLLALTMLLLLCSCMEEDESGEFWNEELSPEEAVSEPSEQPTGFALPYLQNQTLDPITCTDGIQQTVSSLLYEGLFELDETFTPQKVLCRDYTYDAAARTYTFHVRDDALFSDGSALTASDVIITYRRAAASERYAARFADVVSMQLDGDALIITLTQENRAFPALLDIPIVKSGSEKNLVPLGTGPYLFLTDSESTCLIQNGDWWRGTAVPFERIPLYSARDNSTAAYMFPSLDVHLLVSDLTATNSPGTIGTADIYDADTTSLLYLGFNTRRAPLTSSILRRAMSSTIDRNVIISTLLSGHACAAQYPISPSAALYPTAMNIASEDYPQAVSLAGINDAHPRELTLLVNEESSFKLSVAERLCRQLTAGALTVTLKALPWSSYLAALQSGSFDLYLAETRLTADWNAASLISSTGTLNYGGYTDANMDALLQTFLADSNATAAQAYCRYFAENAPIAPIAFKSVSVQTAPGLIRSISPTASNPFYGFEDWVLSFEP